MSQLEELKDWLLEEINRLEEIKSRCRIDEAKENVSKKVEILQAVLHKCVEIEESHSSKR